MRTLRAIFSWAVPEYLRENPARPVRFAEEPERDKRILSLDELVQVLEVADLRALGETRSDRARQRRGAITSQSSNELMLGGTVVGARLRDLRAVLEYLRGRSEVDSRKIALWGDSFAKLNPAERDFQVPRDVDDRPR